LQRSMTHASTPSTRCDAVVSQPTQYIPIETLWLVHRRSIFPLRCCGWFTGHADRYRRVREPLYHWSVAFANVPVFRRLRFRSCRTDDRLVPSAHTTVGPKATAADKVVNQRKCVSWPLATLLCFTSHGVSCYWVIRKLQTT
jgi:hypothetical protein